MSITVNRIRITDPPIVKRTNDRSRRILIRIGPFSFAMTEKNAIDLANHIADALETP